MTGICKEAGLIFALMVCSSIKHSSEQMSNEMTVNGHSAIQNVTGSENNSVSSSFAKQLPVDNGINIGESFFLNRLRQGDSNAFMRLGQLHQTVDTPMSLLHNFFRAFSQPNLRQRTGFVSLLHNLAVARGLLPNSLAIGTDGVPAQNTVNIMSNATTVAADTQNANIIKSERESSGSVSKTNFKLNDSNTRHSNVNGQVSDLNSIANRPTTTVIFSSNEIRDSREIVGLASEKRLQDGVNLAPVHSNMTTATITNNIFPANIVRSSNVHINQRQTNEDQINISTNNNLSTEITEIDKSQTEDAFSRDTTVRESGSVSGQNIDTALNGVSKIESSEFITGRRTQVGGRFALPSTRLQRRKFSQEGSEQRGAQILSRNVVSQIRNGTVLNTLKELILNRTKKQTQTTVFNRKRHSNLLANLQRPSKLNFMLEMPKGVTLRDRTEKSELKNIANRARIRTIDTINLRNMTARNETLAGEIDQHVGDNIVSQSVDNEVNNKKEVLMKIHGSGVSGPSADLTDILQKNNENISVDPFALQAGNKFILQRVGHIQLDPADHILQIVGEMNLTLSPANYNIQRVGDLNIGRRRQFVMEVTVNASSDEDKILLQRVGSTDIVPSERIQLHGTGDVRLLTKERVIIQRLGFVRFHTDPLKNKDKESTETDEVKSIIRIEPLTSDTKRPSLLFLGNETSFSRNDTSNETVLQFVGDVISGIPDQIVNITHQTRLGFDNKPNLRGVTGPLVRERLNEALLPVLRETISLQSKQNPIFNNNPSAGRIHLNPIGRIFSTAEMKFETR